MRLKNGRKKHEKRRGTMTVELLLVLPILLTLLLAMIQFSLMLTARQQLLAASREGARVAARGGNDEEVQASVQRVLGNGSLSQAQVEVRHLPEDPNNSTSREMVEVVVHIPTRQAIPVFLAWLSPAGDELAAGTAMHRE